MPTSSVDARNAGLDAEYNKADGGLGPAVIEVRTGSRPATPETTATGTVLATFTCADPAFLPAAGGVKDLDADPDLTATAVAAGTAGWARMQTSDGTGCQDYTLATSGSEMTINSTTITVGQEVKLTLGSITAPVG